MKIFVCQSFLRLHKLKKGAYYILNYFAPLKNLTFLTLLTNYKND